MVKIVYKSSVARDLKRVDKTRVTTLIIQLEELLSKDPEAEEPLKGEFRGLYKLRVGDYRVIYSKIEGGLLILRVGHRSKAYED